MFLCFIYLISILLKTLATIDVFSVSIVLPFPEYVNVIIQNVAFTNWLISLSVMYLRVIQVLYRYIVYFCLSLNSTPLYGCTTVALSIHWMSLLSLKFYFQVHFFFLNFHWFYQPFLPTSFHTLYTQTHIHTHKHTPIYSGNLTISSK